MAKPSVLMLYNQPLLAKDHPDADSEHTVVLRSRSGARVQLVQYLDLTDFPDGRGGQVQVRPSARWDDLGLGAPVPESGRGGHRQREPYVPQWALNCRATSVASAGVTQATRWKSWSPSWGPPSCAPTSA